MGSVIQLYPKLVCKVDINVAIPLLKIRHKGPQFAPLRSLMLYAQFEKGRYVHAERACPVSPCSDL